MNNNLIYTEEMKKIVIALCDDNKSAVKQLEELIWEYLKKKMIEVVKM